MYFLQFEYQQAQLEAEIENLSWKIEHAETTDRGDLENQMDVAEKRRYTFNAQEYLINFEQFQDKSTQRLFTYVNFHSEKNVILSFQLVDGCKMYFLSLLFTISPPRLESNNEINVVPSFVNVTQAFCHVINTKIYEKLLTGYLLSNSLSVVPCCLTIYKWTSKRKIL